MQRCTGRPWAIHGPRHLLAPVPLRQKIHRPGDREDA
jgi:hypothetical protein